MAQRPHPPPDDVAGLCRRNAVHVVKLARTTHPQIGFDLAGVRWLARYIDDHRVALTAELATEFVQLMGCFYGECLLAQFGGRWARSGGRLGVRTDGLGFTYPFSAVERHVRVGAAASVATSFVTAVDYVTNAA